MSPSVNARAVGEFAEPRSASTATCFSPGSPPKPRRRSAPSRTGVRASAAASATNATTPATKAGRRDRRAGGAARICETSPPEMSTSRSARRSSIEGYRCAGSFSRHSPTTCASAGGRSGQRSESEGGSSLTTMYSSAA